MVVVAAAVVVEVAKEKTMKLINIMYKHSFCIEVYK